MVEQSKKVRPKIQLALPVVPWTASQTIGITILAYIVSQLFTILPLLLALFFVSGSEINDTLLDAPWMSLALTGVAASGLLLTLITFFKYKNFSLRNLGFYVPFAPRHLFIIALVFAVYLFVSGVVTVIISSLIPGFNVNQEQEVGFAAASGWQLVLAFIGLVIIPPFAEELLFRGFLYQGLKSKWNTSLIIKTSIALVVPIELFISPWAGIALLVITTASVWVSRKNVPLSAALISGALFGLVHMQWNVAIDTFILSFALVYVFEKTGTIWSAIGLHALKNGVAFVGLFLLS
jgi:membrane protease YdiL (CAAX protease family)